MLKHIVALVGLSLALSACSLTNANSTTFTQIETITPTSTVTESDTNEVASSPTEVILPTATLVMQSENNAPAVVDTTDCVLPNTNLPTYTVLSGDTLSIIATRTGDTVAELVRLNCLDDTNLIASGQQLYVSNPITNQDTQPSNEITVQDTEPDNASQPVQSNPTTVIDLANIPINPTSYRGSIIPSSWVAQHDGVYVLEENANVQLTWSFFPDDLDITQVGFVIKPNNKVGGHILVATDSNLSDGIRGAWQVPVDAQYDIFAVGQITGQSQLVVSESIRVGSWDTSEPFVSRSYGTTSVSPVIEMVNPSQVVVSPNSMPITIEWLGTSAFNYHLVDNVSFYYQDDNGTSLLGVDEDDNDGISISLTTHPLINGVIYAEGEFMQAAPQVFYVSLTMPEIQINVFIEGCNFHGYGIGAPHAIYPSPDFSTTPISEIPANIVYPVLEQGEEFHQVDLGNQSGWIASHLGGLVGEC